MSHVLGMSYRPWWVSAAPSWLFRQLGGMQPFMEKVLRAYASQLVPVTVVAPARRYTATVMDDGTSIYFTADAVP